jgi:hypothetical protein
MGSFRRTPQRSRPKTITKFLKKMNYLFTQPQGIFRYFAMSGVVSALFFFSFFPRSAIVGAD